MYEFKPAGRHKIGICTNIPCMLRGAEEIADCRKKRLGIGFGESTADGLFALRESNAWRPAAVPRCVKSMTKNIMKI